MDRPEAAIMCPSGCPLHPCPHCCPQSMCQGLRPPRAEMYLSNNTKAKGRKNDGSDDRG